MQERVREWLEQVLPSFLLLSSPASQTNTVQPAQHRAAAVIEELVRKQEMVRAEIEEICRASDTVPAKTKKGKGRKKPLKSSRELLVSFLSPSCHPRLLITLFSSTLPSFILTLLPSSSRLPPSSFSRRHGGGEDPGFDSWEFEPDAIHVGLDVLLQILFLL